MHRHGRQSRLAEIGAAGQERIAAWTAEVHSSGLAAEVATRYLAGAGVGRLRVRDPALAAVAAAADPAVKVEVVGGLPREPREPAGRGPEPFFRDPVAAALAQGAREALGQIRRALQAEVAELPEVPS